MGKLGDYEDVCLALSDKKAQDIVVLNLGDAGTLADVFILATGNSEVHMKTLTETAEEALRRRGAAVQVEGEHSANWRLIDAGDVAVHIFSRKGREFYKLEKLWAEAEPLRYEESLPYEERGEGRE